MNHWTTPMLGWLTLMLVAIAPVAAEDATAGASQPVSFARDIAPLLVGRCQGCHGPQEAQSEYRVDQFALINKPGASGSAPLVPQKPADSPLFQLITSTDPDSRMPKDAEPLSAAETALVERWITEGATFDGPSPEAPLASYLPRSPQPAAPVAYPSAWPVTAVAFDPAGQELATSGYHEVLIWSVTDGRLLRRIGNLPERIYDLAFHPSAPLLAIAAGTPGRLGETLIVDPTSGSLVRVLSTMSDVAYGVAFNTDGSRLAASGADRSVRVFDTASGQQSLLIEDHADWVHDVAWSPDGSKLVTASRDKTSKIFDATSGEPQVTYSGHGQSVFTAAFSADGTQALSGGADNLVRVWKPDDAAAIADIGGISDEVHRLLVRPSGIFACSADRVVRQFKGDTRELVRAFEGHADWVYTLDVHEGSGRLASGSFDGQVRVWNLADGAPVTTFFAAPGWTPPAR